MAAILERRAAPVTHRAALQLTRVAEQLAREAADAERLFAQCLARAEQRPAHLPAASDGNDDVRDDMSGDGAATEAPAAAAPARVHSAEEWARIHALNPAAFVAAAEAASHNLWPHQRAVAALVARNEAEIFAGVRGGVLNEPVGNGKTRTVLHVILSEAVARVRAGGPRFGQPTLVVVPKNLQLQWEDEIRKYYGPHLLAFRRVAVSSAASARDAALDVDVAHVAYCLDLVITSYDTLKSAVRAMEETGGARTGLFAVPWARLVLDEGATIANRKTAVFHACGLLEARCRLLISATPQPNSRARELNAILAFLRCDHRVANEDDAPDEANDALRAKLIARYLLRVTTENASGHTLETTTVWLDLETKEERAAYAEVMRGMHGAQGHYIKWVTKARAACISPVFLGGKEARLALPADRVPSTKFAWTLGYLLGRVAPDEKMLIFCEWKQPLFELGHHLTRAGLAYVLVEGDTPERERMATFRAFCSDAPGTPRILLLTNKLGERGLNLQRANHILQLCGHWTPATDVQLNGRINRPGQTRPMHSFKLVTRCTIDMAVLLVNEQKARRQAAMFEGSADRPPVVVDEEITALQHLVRRIDREKRARKVAKKKRARPDDTPDTPPPKRARTQRKTKKRARPAEGEEGRPSKRARAEQ